MKRIKPCLFFLFLLLLGGANVIQAQVGLLSLCDDLNMNSSSSYEAEISDLSGAGSGHDQVTVAGDLSLSGNLDILLSGYDPNSADAFEIMCYSGTLTGTFTTINWPADMIAQGWTIDYGILNPGKITIYGSSSSLPIELLGFSVAVENGNHLLSWETAVEINNDFFAVEHSTNGRDFSVLGIVNGQGTSFERQEYNYVHKPSQTGFHYYRLQQVDFDEQYEYSKVISIFDSIEKTVSFFPNPTSGIITFNEPQSRLIVYNLMGQLVLNIDDQNTSFDLSGLPSGTYFIASKDASSLMKRLVISNK